MAAAVPMTHEAKAAMMAMVMVVPKAPKSASSENICTYQRVENPPQLEVDLMLLKENIMRMTIGKYKNKNIKNRYIFSIKFLKKCFFI